MTHHRSQRGFTLFELAIVLAIALAIGSIALVLGRQATDQSRTTALTEAVGQVVGEVHRLYTDSATGYTDITASDAMSRGANLTGIWNATTAKWSAGSVDITVSNADHLPGGAIGTVADGFMLDLRPLDDGLCRQMIQGLSKQATGVTVIGTDGSNSVDVTTSPGIAATAAVEAACATGVPKAMRVYYN